MCLEVAPAVKETSRQVSSSRTKSNLSCASSTEGIKYNTSNDYYEVLLGKKGEVKLVNMYGEVITASGSEYLLKGTKVILF